MTADRELLGRAEELAELERHLEAGGAALVAGDAGLG